MRFLKIAPVFALLIASLMAPAAAAPTCVEQATRPLCGNRVIAPPLQSATFLQYASEYKPALDAIESVAPDIIEVQNLADAAGMPGTQSTGGRDVYVVKVTDESVDAPKRQVAISLSVHGNESAGREGGLRYLDDIAYWWANGDTEHPLYAGDVSFPLSDVLAQTEIYIAVVNVDGWAGGDLGRPGAGFSRGNSTGADLNRDYPTLGWTKQNQLIQPETKMWTTLVSSLPNLATASDIHGELTSNTNSFSDIMYPAGQWDPTEQARELSFASNMRRTIERKFQEEGVVLQTVFDAIGEEDRPMKPAEYATAFDIVGYDDSGFMGDWFVSQGATEVDIENFLSHTVPNNVWFGPLEQAHVAAVKGQVESIISESMLTESIEASLDLGDVAYVYDPVRITREASEGQAAYDASRMDYFTELAPYTDGAVDPIAAADVATADLSGYDSLVLDDMEIPADTEGRAVDAGAYFQALSDFATGGGQLVLTDGAVQVLDDLGAFPSSAIRTVKHQGGKVDFGDLDDPWEEDLSGLVNQTYYAVPLGYRSSSSIREAPHWGITDTDWEAAGGTTVGTVSSDVTNLGRLPFGDGQIAIFGSILPTQFTGHRIDHGLADFAVSVTGGQVLHSILEYRRAGGEILTTIIGAAGGSPLEGIEPALDRGGLAFGRL